MGVCGDTGSSLQTQSTFTCRSKANKLVVGVMAGSAWGVEARRYVSVVRNSKNDSVYVVFFIIYLETFIEVSVMMLKVSSWGVGLVLRQVW